MAGSYKNSYNSWWLSPRVGEMLTDLELRNTQAAFWWQLKCNQKRILNAVQSYIGWFGCFNGNPNVWNQLKSCLQFDPAIPSRENLIYRWKKRGNTMENQWFSCEFPLEPSYWLDLCGQARHVLPAKGSGWDLGNCGGPRPVETLDLHQGALQWT